MVRASTKMQWMTFIDFDILPTIDTIAKVVHRGVDLHIQGH